MKLRTYIHRYGLIMNRIGFMYGNDEITYKQYDRYIAMLRVSFIKTMNKLDKTIQYTEI